MPNTFRKAERLNRRKVIGKMFSRGGSHSFTVFPLRVVYLVEPELTAWASVLISVSKRHFKKAVSRNRLKRQIREAYRLNSHSLTSFLEKEGMRVAIAFIYLSDEMPETRQTEVCIQTALSRIERRLAKQKHAEP